MVFKTTLLRLLMATMPSALQCQLVPLKIGSFHQPMSQNDLGRGFKLNVAPGEDSFKKKVFDGTLEIQPMTTSTTVSTVIKDSKSLEESMEIGGRLAVSYGPTISGEGSGNYLDKSVSSTRQVTVVYRSRHTAFFKRLQPSTLTPTQDATDIISQPQALADNFGTQFVDTIVYGAQLDVSFTVKASKDIDIEEIEAELKGRIGTGALNIEFAAKFKKQDGQERAAYNMNIAAEATGVLVTIPANPDFETVDKIIDDFNIEYTTKFEDFKIEDIPLLEQIEPVGFMLSATADRIDTLNKMEVAVLEDRMEKLGRSFSDTMLWKAKLNLIDRDLKTRYESNHKLRVEMYHPYIKQQQVKMKALNDKINEYLAFRASSLTVLVASNTTVPDVYPMIGSADEGVMRGLSGEYFLPDPVKFGDHDPLQDMYYIGFALGDEDEMIPWMNGCLKRDEDNIVIATAETPEELYSKAQPRKGGYSRLNRGTLPVCPNGRSLTLEQCRKAGLALGAQLRDGKNVLVGAWTHAPSGCFTNPTEDNAVHYSVNPIATPDARYSLLCRKYAPSADKYIQYTRGTVAKCPEGKALTKEQCLEAGLAFSGFLRKGKVLVSSWANTPSGCFLLPTKDNAIHYSENMVGTKKDDQFTALCLK